MAARAKGSKKAAKAGPAACLQAWRLMHDGDRGGGSCNTGGAVEKWVALALESHDLSRRGWEMGLCHALVTLPSSSSSGPSTTAIFPSNLRTVVRHYLYTPTARPPARRHAGVCSLPRFFFFFFSSSPCLHAPVSRRCITHTHLPSSLFVPTQTCSNFFPPLPLSPPPVPRPCPPPRTYHAAKERSRVSPPTPRRPLSRGRAANLWNSFPKRLTQLATQRIRARRQRPRRLGGETSSLALDWFASSVLPSRDQKLHLYLPSEEFPAARGELGEQRAATNVLWPPAKSF